MIKYHLDKTLLRTNTVGIIVNVLEKCLESHIKGGVREEIDYILEQRQISMDTTKHMRASIVGRPNLFGKGGKK